MVIYRYFHHVEKRPISPTFQLLIQYHSRQEIGQMWHASTYLGSLEGPVTLLRAIFSLWALECALKNFGAKKDSLVLFWGDPKVAYSK